MSFEKAAEFHGHQCPGLAIGYRVAQIALDKFKNRSEDEELVAIVENNSCAVDAIQALTGCTFGKGNFVFKDYGKHVYTFIKRGDEKGIRISLKPQNDPASERHLEIFKKIQNNRATEEEIREFRKIHEQKTVNILEAPENEIFHVENVSDKAPQKAQIFETIICDECGEGVMSSRTKTINEKYVCIPCYEKLC
ncbi:formylmethanofuran dehydrogenase subunit E region [Methanohalobium evestigatum Z-7303]|uniref:Formylmethanofuran dehydrogenase subunit E region n=1 Tax=Methanohalobium evestigatum (strain ATCC BAA-1072 / DSM 3721 / NBRC 107634 / OCM 161 / Z-7303) TaxID=644295 RepID=D7E627_METEZ|nr:FmdE family protein [Methanohalobium evestigatum]ADI73049.1 formylmethanofuran dehydrogenase subunit E region [Methanohalobium evestigatum Z-7303]